jgi:uncharacterized phiE125 gp8 family phage protein
MNYVERIAAPTLRPVSLDEAKEHLRITGSVEDTVLAIYLDSAIAACENKLQTAIMSSRFKLYATSFNTWLSLQKKFVNEIVSVSYYDTEGDLQTVASPNYDVQTFRSPNVLYFNDDVFDQPSTDGREFPVEVIFNAGATAASGVIPTIRNAVLIECADRFEHRHDQVIGTSVGMVNKTAEMLLAEEAIWL